MEEHTEIVQPFILVKPNRERSSYRENIIIQTDQGPMLIARVEKYQRDSGQDGDGALDSLILLVIAFCVGWLVGGIDR